MYVNGKFIPDTLTDTHTYIQRTFLNGKHNLTDLVNMFDKHMDDEANVYFTDNVKVALFALAIECGLSPHDTWEDFTEEEVEAEYMKRYSSIEEAIYVERIIPLLNNPAQYCEVVDEDEDYLYINRDKYEAKVEWATNPLIDTTNQVVIRHLTQEELIEDAVARGNIDALRWLEDKSVEMKARKNGKTTNLSVMEYRTEYLTNFAGYQKVSKINADAAKAREAAKREAERRQRFEDAFKRLRNK